MVVVFDLFTFQFCFLPSRIEPKQRILNALKKESSERNKDVLAGCGSILICDCRLCSDRKFRNSLSLSESQKLFRFLLFGSRISGFAVPVLSTF
jgi:hypothetical protein